MTTRRAAGLAIVGGVALVLQSRVNAVLSVHLRPGGAPVPAAAAAFCLAAAVLYAVCLATRARPAAHEQLARTPARWWYRIGGLGGAALVGSSAAAVPVIGTALTAVFVVTGQTAGSLGVDAAGLGPSGRHPPTGPRLAGALLGVAALVVGALGGHGGGLTAGVLAAVVVAGVLVAGQQAANGRLQAASGSAPYAALTSFVGGALVLVLASLALLAAGRLHGLRADGPWWMWLGGLGGSVYITLAARCVPVLGVLRLSLASVVGQLAGGLVLDLVVPTAGTHVRVETYLAVALTVAALLVSGRRPRRRLLPS